MDRSGIEQTPPRKNASIFHPLERSYTYEGPSPIADPDLHLVDPETFTPLDAPILRGCALPEPVLKALYVETASTLLG